MAITLTALTDLATLGFDTLIDVRSPAEYDDDHIPGAINLPVLDNDERARVGTIYKQVNPFTARKIGGALVARNAARHIEGPLADKPGGWRPLVYCWRGGQRSGSFATILSQIGWRAETIAGGYKAYRALVVQACYDTPVAAPVILLDGNTGSAKTELLHLLTARGVQVIDLEGMANHRGSLFGAMPGGQPSQRAFESRLAAALATLDPTRPVVIEAESSKVGNLSLPSPLWKAMCAAPRLRITAPRAARARYLARAYADLTADPAQLAGVIDLLRPLHAAEVIHRWHALAAESRFELLADDLMARHYDPRYDKQRARTALDAGDEFTTDDLTPAALDTLAARLVARLAARVAAR
jgi:tRNA 2-selenouridine synthase